MSQVGQVTSQGSPQDGQKNRSSNNFPSFSIPSGTSNLQWNVSLQGSGEVTQLRFNVMQDVSGGSDPTLLSDMSAGETAPVGSFESGGSYYIANPTNNISGDDFGTSFVVTVDTA